MPDYIGGFPTLFAPRVPDRPSQRVRTEYLPGEAGELLVLEAAHADEFVVASETPCISLLAAAALIPAYQALQGAGPQRVIWGGVDLWSVWGVGYSVLRVTLEDMGAIQAAIAPLEFGYPVRAYASVTWRLQPVFI